MREKGKRGAKKRTRQNTRKKRTKGPLVFAANLLLLLRSEVVRDVERFADLLGRFALDHIRDREAGQVEQGLWEIFVLFFRFFPAGSEKAIERRRRKKEKKSLRQKKQKNLPLSLSP